MLKIQKRLDTTSTSNIDFISDIEGVILEENTLSQGRKTDRERQREGLKGGCTRFEVEHISCNSLLYIGKT